jgi:phage-related protein
MSFTFNGINSDAMGLFVERYPERPFPSRKQSVYSIKGRSGDLIVDENAFTNVTQTYEVYILGGSAGFQAKATAIANWLLSPI